MPETLQPGLYPGLSFVDYLALEAVNNTTLRAFRRTPAHAHHELTHPEEVTDALRVGDAAHVAILEPRRFEKSYVKAPKFDLRTIKGKAAAAEWEAAHGELASLKPDEWELACAMRDAVWSSPLAAALLKAPGHTELAVVWKDEKSGRLCKGRLDRLLTYEGWSIVLDLKTPRDADAWAFAKSIVEFGYHQQAAFYLDGLNAIAPHERRFFHLAIEKKPPYCCAVFELDDTAIAEGRAQYRIAIDTLVECEKSGLWPGYPVGVQAIDLPAWAYHTRRDD